MTTTEKHVCPPDHRHAETGNCHSKHGCRCAACLNRHSTYQRELRKRKAYGRYTPPARVPAEPVREHLAALKAFGIAPDRAARIAGVGVITVRRLVFGRTGRGADRSLPERLDADRARRLLAVRADISLVADAALVSSRGTQRRIQALAVQGWSQLEVSRRLGMDRSNANKILAADHVTALTHRRVADLFDVLWDKTPPQHTAEQAASVQRIRERAKRRGWQPALAWDDIDLDAGPARVERANDDVDDSAVELAIAGEGVDLTPAERRIAVRRLHADGLTDPEIAARLHCSDRTVLRIRFHEFGLPHNDTLHNPTTANQAA
jgi:hypothetical protein